MKTPTKAEQKAVRKEIWIDQIKTAVYMADEIFCPFLVSDNIEGGNESKTVTRIVFGSGERIKKILFEIANDMASGKTRESENEN